MRVNLLKETIQIMEFRGLLSEDIVFIGDSNSGHQCSWEEFVRLADFEYNNGYGGAVIVETLEIVFSCGARMSRGEYDGSEWWEVQMPFKMPSVKREIKSLKYSYEGEA